MGKQARGRLKNRSSHRRRRFQLETLEARRLLASVTLTIDPATISEGAGATAAMVTIDRGSDTSSSLSLSLTSSDPSEATVPASVQIAAGVSTVSVPLAAIDDTVIDGTQVVTISASQTTPNQSVTSDPEFGTAGSVTTTLRNNISPQQLDVAVQPDGKVVAVGRHESLDNAWRVLRLNQDGSSDSAFGAGGSVVVQFGGESSARPEGIVLHDDGRITLIGHGNNADWLFARLDSNGSPDVTFSGDGLASIAIAGSSRAYKGVLNPDGSMLVVGELFNSQFNTSGSVVGRITPAGSLDNTFGTGGTIRPVFSSGFDERPADIAATSNGKFVIAGKAISETGVDEAFVAQFHSNGTIDETFGAGGIRQLVVPNHDVQIHSVAVQNDGAIVVAGQGRSVFSTSNIADWLVARFTPQGSVDSTFSSDGYHLLLITSQEDVARDVVIQSDQRILIVGTAFISGNGHDRAMARFLPNGSLDPTFGVAGVRTLPPFTPTEFEQTWAAALGTDGKLVTYSGWSANYRIERWILPNVTLVLGAADVAVTDNEAAGADFGDAPDSYGTSIASGGAYHGAIGPRLGALRDIDLNGAPSTAANGDDTLGQDDEDGVTLSPVAIGDNLATLSVNVQNAASGARLDAWIDFDGDGSWNGVTERVARGQLVVEGDNTVSFAVPAWAKPGDAYARIRLSTAGVARPDGPAPDGEVEDYLLPVSSRVSRREFAPVQRVGTVDTAQTVFAADLDRDGHTDVISGEFINRLAWFDNDGAGMFTRQDIVSSGSFATDEFVADLDSDGDWDVIHSGSNRLQIFENDGSQNFTVRQISTAAVESIAIADLDGDGDLDMTVGELARVSIWINTGGLQFTRTVLGSFGGSAVDATDLDRDGDVDIAVVSGAFFGNEVGWYENDGHGSFTLRAISQDVVSSDEVRVGDLDNDGDGDLVVATGTSVYYYENNGSPSFSLQPVLLNFGTVRHLELADMDGDGRIDVLVAGNGFGIAGLYNGGGGAFTRVDVDAGEFAQVAAADFNSDGRLDIVAAKNSTNEAVWYAGTALGSMISIAADIASTAEGDSGTTEFSFVVTRSGETDAVTTVDFAVLPTGVNAATAADFGGVFPSGSLTFQIGQSSIPIAVSVTGDVQVEPSETFQVLLSNASGPAVISGASAVGTIIDDDSAVDVSGILFADANADGVMDPADTLRAGVTVYADLDGDSIRDPGEPSTITLADGSYLLTELPPGETIIAIEGVAGQTVTTEIDPIPRLFTSGDQLVYELSPTTGETIASFGASTSLTHGSAITSMATDGRLLYWYDAILQQLLIVDPAQSIDQPFVIDTITLPTNANQTYRGLAIIGDLLYILEATTDSILPIDLNTKAIGAMINVPLANQGTAYDPWTFDFVHGLGESHDGEHLIASTSSNGWLVIDPATGLITDSIGGGSSNVVGIGVASTSNRLYAGQNSVAVIHVYDAGGNELDLLPIQVEARNVAAGPSSRAGGLVTLVPGQSRANLDFGLATLGGSISGTQFVDTNGNGSQDVGESPLAGVVVYVDANNNAWPDVDELQTTSSADGTYMIAGVPDGTHVVRALTPSDYRPSDAYPTTDRLFAIAPGASLGNAKFAMRVFELNPLTGDVISQFNTPHPIDYQTGLAFDGDRLIVFDNDSAQDLVYELTLDGQLIDQSFLGGENPVGGGGLPADDFGPTVVGDAILSVRKVNRQLFITRFDPESNEFTIQTPVSIQWGLSELPLTHFPTEPATYASTLGRSIDGRSIILYSEVDSQTLTIDVATGIATPGTADFSGLPYTVTNLYEATESVGGETFRFKGNNEIEVIDDVGTLLRTLPINFFAYGLGGGAFRDNSVNVSLSSNQPIAIVDHAAMTTRGTVSGHVAGASVGTAVTVYVDSNRNGVPDPDEPATLADSSGDYTLSGLAHGEQLISVAALPGQVVHADGQNETRLYLYVSENGGQTISEIDSRNGSVLRSFPGPGTANRSTGMALSHGQLYIGQADRIYVLNAETGEAIKEFQITSGDYRGMAVVGPVAYLVDTQSRQLRAFDLVSWRLISTLDLSQLGIDVNNLGGMGEWVDGSSLVLRSGADAVVLDPVSGNVTQTIPNVVLNAAVAGAGNEWFDSGIFLNGQLQSIDARDGLGLLRRRMQSPQTGFVDGLAAEQTIAPEHRVVVTDSTPIFDRDFSIVAATRSVSGYQFVDANENGTFDPGESPLAGVVVFADTNGNLWPDSGELTTISSADGGYTLAGVPNGGAIIRSVIPPNFAPTTITGTQDRLFVSSFRDDPTSPIGRSMDLREIDLQTGAILSTIPTAVPMNAGGASTAFDGSRIYVTENSLDVIYEVAVDGTILDQTPLPWAGTNRISLGPVFVNGSIYVMTAGGGDGPQMTRFDPETNLFDPLRQVTEARIPGVSAPAYSATLAESPDGRSVIAFSQTLGAYLIDPATGRASEIAQLANLSGAKSMSSSVGGELFVYGADTNGLHVYNSNYELQRVLQLPFSRVGLAGGTQVDHGIKTLLQPGQTLSGANMGYRSTAPEIAGRVLLDSNGDGVSDGFDAPAAGAVVYLDANRNATLDAGELSVTTDSLGTYEFSSVPVGQHDVRVVTSGLQWSTTSEQVTRLFVSTGNASAPDLISELDPRTGQALRSFSAPFPPSNQVGMAIDARGLYFSTEDRLWVIDPNSGTPIGSVGLPPQADGSQANTGVAAVGGHVFVLSPNDAAIRKIDPVTRQTVDVFDINAINAGHPEGSFVFQTGALGESPDGTQLLAFASGRLITIDPDTGVVVSTTPNQQVADSLGSTGGEVFAKNDVMIDVLDANLMRTRRLMQQDSVRSIAAAQLPSARYVIHASPDTNATTRDFLLRSHAAPTEIALSKSSVNENIDTSAIDAWFADLSAVDATPIDDHTFALVSGLGDADNSRFSISGHRIQFRPGQVIDFEVKSSYSVRVEVTDSTEQTHVQILTLAVNDLVELAEVKVNDGTSQQRSRVSSMTLVFDGSVVVAADAFTITNRDASKPGEVAYTIPSQTFAEGRTTVVVQFAGTTHMLWGSLLNGRYEMTINPAKVTSTTGQGLDANRDGVAGDDYTYGDDANEKFFRYYGDFSGDGLLSVTDLSRFRSTFGRSIGQLGYLAEMDYNADGVVAISDLSQFRRNFGRFL